MSMPQRIHVALVGAKMMDVAEAKKHFRLSQPGIGPSYYCALDSSAEKGIVSPSNLPAGCITLWLCLDAESLAVSKKLHARDLGYPKYGRGFYGETFPEPCVLLEKPSGKVGKKVLAAWEQKITEAWYATS